MSETNTNLETSDVPLPVIGILAEFDGAEAVKAAAAKVREAGYRRFDVHSPYPIHGIDRAMGIRNTPLPWLVLGAGMTGIVIAVLMQWWMNGYDYPLNISGKPIVSLPAYVPILFELMVLLAAITTFGGVLGLNLLPQFWHWTFNGTKFPKVTSDGFFISIEARDKIFDETTVRRLLEAAGAKSIETCVDVPASEKRIPWLLKWGVGAVAVAALVPPLLVANYRYSTKTQPRIHPIQDLDFQEKYKPQSASPLFADGRAMRPPVPGTVADGWLQADDHLYRGLVDDMEAETFPMPVTKAMVERGQQRFNIYCATCHGLQGDGGSTSIISRRAMKRIDATTDPPGWVPPLSLHKEDVRKQPVGKYFSTITNGIRTMPGCAAQIPVEDRWAIIFYMRALQRPQNATPDDVPDDLRDQLK